MKKTELIQLIENTTKKVLSEAFKNKNIQKFFDLIKSDLISKGQHKPTLYRLNTVLWSEIPEDDRIKILQDTDDIKKYIKDNSYYIFWINTKDKKLVKWKEPRYSKYGSKHDRSIYARKGLVGISKGVIFQITDYSKAFKDIDSNYDKPNGIQSVKAVSEISDYALCIPSDIVNKYNSVPLQNSRTSARSSALALRDLEGIKNDNIRRYKSIIKQNKITDKSKAYNEEYKKLLNKFLTIYKNLSANINTIDDIRNFDKKVLKLKDTFITFASVFSAVLEYIKNVEENPQRDWYQKTLESYINDFDRLATEINDSLVNFE